MRECPSCVDQNTEADTKTSICCSIPLCKFVMSSIACSEIQCQVALSCLAVISLFFKEIIGDGEFKVLTTDLQRISVFSYPMYKNN